MIHQNNLGHIITRNAARRREEGTRSDSTPRRRRVGFAAYGWSPLMRERA